MVGAGAEASVGAVEAAAGASRAGVGSRPVGAVEAAAVGWKPIVDLTQRFVSCRRRQT